MPVPGQGAAPDFRFMNGDFTARVPPDLSLGQVSVHDTERLAEISADHGMVVTGRRCPFGCDSRKKKGGPRTPTGPSIHPTRTPLSTA